MAKKDQDNLKKIDDILKKKNKEKISLQRKVPELIKNSDTVELENIYEQIGKLSDEIYVLERKRIQIRQDL